MRQLILVHVHDDPGIRRRRAEIPGELQLGGEVNDVNWMPAQGCGDLQVILSVVETRMCVGPPALQPARDQLESLMKVSGNEVNPSDADVPKPFDGRLATGTRRVNRHVMSLR